MRTTDKRLADLERALATENGDETQVILYQVGEPLPAPRPGAKVILFIPDNGRDEKTAENGTK